MATANILDKFSFSRAKRRHDPNLPFKYDDALPEGYIRLLELSPGRGNEMIHVELKTVKASKVKCRYEAISYVWGDSSDRDTISCNGRILSITKNLADALCTMRRPFRKRVLWADAICINQTSNTEKNHQVKHMGQIYENARRVLIWLGNDTDGIARETFAMVRNLVAYYEREHKKHGSIYKMTFAMVDWSLPDHQISWGHIGKLLLLEWFGRVWVVQEAALARTAVAAWGTAQLDIADISSLTIYYSYLTEATTSLLDASERADHITSIFESIQSTYTNQHTWRTSKRILLEISRLMDDETERRFLYLLENARTGISSDKRDMVYAFLGSPLARREDGSILLDPQYSKSMLDAYFDVNVACLNNQREAPLVLELASHNNLSEIESRNYPSWALRWDRDRIDEPIVEASSLMIKAGGATSSFKSQILDQKRLVVQGIIISRLVWTSSILPTKDDFKLDASEWRDLFRSQQTCIFDFVYEELQDHVGVDSQDLFEHYAVALMMPQTFREERDIRDVLYDFQNYVRLAREVSKVTVLSESDMTEGVRWVVLALRFVHNRRIAYTESGSVVLVPHLAQPGDVCCVVLGVKVPLILRKAPDGCYNVVGDAYIHEVMDGSFADSTGERVQDIVLV